MEEKAGKALTAGIIIIGDEILKGHVQDTNSHYLCHQLWLLGINVCKIAVVADAKEAIVEEVRRFAAAFDFVITTGGVGPTHDDVTVEAVGEAFGEDCIDHPDILNVLFGDKKNDTSSPWRKMAYAPKSTKVHVRSTEDKELSYMLVTVHNVHCYPGVPALLKDVFQHCKDLYSEKSCVQFHLRELYLSCDEDVVAKPLALVQKEFGDVQLGSYPDTNPRTSYHVKLTLESVSRKQVEKAYTRLALLLPKDVMMSAQDRYKRETDIGSPDPRKEMSWILEGLPPGTASLLPDSLCAKIVATLSIMEETYKKYSFEEVCVAFNGGKDCTTMLDILHAFLTKKGHDFTHNKLKVLYIVHRKQFPEVEKFVEEAAARYSLDLIQISGVDIRQALSQLKDSHPGFKAIMMGTRRTDPYSADLRAFAPTDDSWPNYMRVNCLLDWSYMEVWLFLRMMAIPYCPLYDRGYTSLDGMEDTHPNSYLAVSTETRTGQELATTESYLPAYMLANEEHERAGRGRA